ncbi:uncharacterized protein TNCV_2706171 [Trichonephila clavipes]|nr:uncharacterized protein TNCV_2706171 [Trichonephila clavipes]
MGREDVPQSTKRSLEAERRRGEGKNAGRNAGRPKVVNQGASWEYSEFPVLKTPLEWSVTKLSYLVEELGCIALCIKGGIQGDSHSGAQRNIKPEMRVGSSFRIIPEQYFSGGENVSEFLGNIDSNLTYYEIPPQLDCEYLKGHLTGRALDWFDVLGYKVVE